MKKIKIEDFKIKLDQFLSKIPDQHKIGDLIAAACDMYTVKPSNSIVDQARVRRNSL